jgi:hypothetical protein
MVAEIILHNSKGEAVASYLHNEQTGKWRISTLPIAEFLSLEAAREAWETKFDRESGLPLRFRSAQDSGPG